MKSVHTIHFIFLCASLFTNSTVKAQIGIGTINPNASAQLDVTSSTKGFLPPRVSLTATNAASPISSPATGLMVYNIATAGTSPNNVTPGYYYYDGSKWQRIINQQPDATVSFNQNTPTTGGVVFTPNMQNSTDYIYVSSTNNSQWTYNGSTYVTYTPPSSTAWYSSGGTMDAGSNKGSTVYRPGNVGIGTTTSPHTSAQLDVNSTTKGFLPPRMTSTERSSILSPAAGLVIYNTTISQIEHYNGSSWTALAAGNSPVYAQFKANASQSGFVIDQTKVNFPVTVVNQGGISVASGQSVTLPAGRIYRVDLNLGFAGGTGWCRFAIYNTVTNGIISETAHLESAVSGGHAAGSGVVTHFINTASGSIQIDVRMRAGGCSLNDPNNGSTNATMTIQAVN